MKIRTFPFVLIIISFVFGACSNTTPTIDHGGDILKPPTSTAAPTKTALSNNSQVTTQNSFVDGPTVITFAVPDFFQHTYLLLANHFNAANPDVVVQIVTPPDDFQAWMGESLYTLASTADATFVFSNQSLSQNSSFFLDLLPLLESNTNFDRGDFWPGSLTACEDSQGKVVGMPLEVNLTGIAFNKAAFDQAGLSHPAPGWSWSDFINAQEVLGGKGLAYLDSQEFFASILATRIDQTINEPGQLQALVASYVQNVHGQKVYPFDEKQTVGQRQSLIIEKQPAMWSVSLGTLLEVEQATLQGLEYSQTSNTGFVPYPVDEKYKLTTPSGVRCALISSGSQHPREVWRWITFLSEYWLAPEDQGNRLQLIPARKSTTEKSGYWSELHDEVEPTIRFALEHAWYGPSDPIAFRAANQAITQTLASGDDFQTAFGSALQMAQAQPTSTPDLRTVIVAVPEPFQLEVSEGRVKYFSDIIDAGALNQLAETYQRDHPQVQIEVVTDLSKYNFQNINVENFTTNFDCFTGPSFYGMDDDPTIRGKLYLLDTFLQTNADLSTDFYPGLLDQYRRDGVLVALPAARSIPTLTYNADLLKQLGLTLPKNNWSFNEFLDFLNTVATKGNSGSPYYGYAMVGDALLLAGRDIQIGDTTPISSYRFYQIEMMNTATWLSQLVSTGAVVRNLSNDPEQVGRLVSTGQVAFWDTGLNGWFFNGNQPSFSTKQVPYPTTVYPVGGSESSAFYISARAKDPAVCWDWINFLSSQPAASRFWPVRKSVATSIGWQTLVGPENVALFEAVKDQAYTDAPSSTEQNALLNIWRDSMEKVYAGIPPQDALTDAQSRADRYFTCVKNTIPGTNIYQIEQISEQCLSKEE